jgi:hypothetical protein
MNKTRRRAIQKHRAKEAKFETRRKNSGESDGKSKGGVTLSGSRSRAPKRQSGEAGE